MSAPHHRLLLLFIWITVLGYGCDSPPGANDPTQSSPQLREVTVQPDSISFEGADRVRDTTVMIHIRSIILNSGKATQPSYVIRSLDSDEPITSGELQAGDSADTFTASVTLELTTAMFTTYQVYVYSDDPNPDGSWIKSKIHIFGFAGSPPVFLDVANPDTVYRPSGDTVRNVPFRAQVTDPDGQDNIARVAFNLVRSGDTLDTIDLFDDGSDQSGDAVAGDSVYTQVLSVNSENELATYDIHYFALDKSGLYSDTVKTTFTIAE